MPHLLTLPDSQKQSLSIRAKALVFNDPSSQELLEQADRVAASDATVLIIGETGTGKELMARHVHTQSGRTGPFLAVNCGAFSENLVEAELFGHETGAYTGASGARAGWFESANNGTLFLDEVGDLPLSIQVKLLRVLQERQVVRLGSRRPINVNVRLVAATNVNLDQAVASGRFRADLYYRLCVATLALPPLSQRPGDILALAEHFIDVYSHRLELRGVQLGCEAKETLLSYSWPGNIRELENAIHYALIVNSGGVIAVNDLRLRGVLAATASTVSDAIQFDRPSHYLPDLSSEPLRSSLDQLAAVFAKLFDEGGDDLYGQIEQVLIQAAYDHCQRNQVHTADLLGISRNVLRTQLKRFGLLAPNPTFTQSRNHHDTFDRPGFSARSATTV
jgi:sigma-54-specific transcriptional regulator